MFRTPWLSGCMCNAPRCCREAKQVGHQFESLNPKYLMKFLHPREPGLQNILLLAITTDLSLCECSLGFVFFQVRSQVYLHALPRRSELSRGFGAGGLQLSVFLNACILPSILCPSAGWCLSSSHSSSPW